MYPVNIHPETPQTLFAFRQVCFAPSPVPFKVYDDTSSRDLKVIFASVEAATKYWRGNKEIYFPGNPTNRQEFWGAFSADHQPIILPVAKSFIEKSEGEGKTAIDLGCGNSAETKLLLQKGWKVIAVDNSKASLDTLRFQNREKHESGQLVIIQEDITSYSPAEPVDLVIASDSLMYSNPSHFQATWTKIHDTFVKENGFLIGTLFRSYSKNEISPDHNLMIEMGAWFFPDRRMIRALLSQTGYTVETCQFRVDEPNVEAKAIQFVAKKMSV